MDGVNKVAIQIQNKLKVVNDPIYGFIRIPYEIIFDLIEHPWFQRLRRIKQMGLSDLVYPGAQHTRFQHALGAMHLMHTAIQILKSKGVEVSEEEAKGAIIAILLHDIGHGPYSHALEGKILPIHHENISIYTMEQLNSTFNGELSLAIQIFKNQYKRSFFHQLVSSQLDMDRLDYLTRDSFFSGVVEGKIGWDRLLYMMNVVNDQLVFEEKGIHSISKFLLSRYIMYKQVYLHKTGYAAEWMLVKFIERAKELYSINAHKKESIFFDFFSPFDTESYNNFSYLHSEYMKLDDSDILFLLKKASCEPDFILKVISNGLLNRNLFGCKDYFAKPDSDVLENLRLSLSKDISLSRGETEYLAFLNEESFSYYIPAENPITVLKKSGELKEVSNFEDFIFPKLHDNKFFLCYYKQ